MKASYFRNNKYALLVLLIAAVLRLVNVGSFDFVHDELSALSRTGFLNFSDLIKKGVLTDTHPPLIQVFLNYWVLIAGSSELAVKLPFILTGLGGIWLVWLIGRSWFGETTGLTVMAFMACSEYVIAYHQQARPYAVGFFLCLLAVWSFTRYFLVPEPGKIKFLILYMIAAACAAFTHHLAMMFAVLFAAGSLFIIPRKLWRPWLLAQLGILLLYLPNLSIMLKQLEQKGVGEWLGAPGLHSFRYIAGWFTHYSYLFALTVVLAASVGIASGWNRKAAIPKRLLLLYLSIACTFIPFFYSIYVNPIFQFSSLFFILPFFLLFIFSGLPQGKPALLIPLVILLAAGGSFLFRRNYYEIAAHQPVAEMCRQSISFLKGHPEKNALVCLNTESWFIEFYQQKYRFNFPFETWYEKEFRGSDLVQMIETRKPDYVILGWMATLAVPISKTSHPCILAHKKSPQLDFYAFGKEQNDHCNEEPVRFESKLFQNPPDAFWEKNPERTIKSDSLQYLVFSQEDEFGTAFETKLDQLPVNRHSVLECTATFLDSLTGNVILCAAFSRDGRELPLIYAAEESARQIPPGSNRRQLYLRTRIVDTFRENQQLRGCKLKVYIWNREKIPLRVAQIKVRWLEGNPEMYGLYEE